MSDSTHDNGACDNLAPNHRRLTVAESDDFTNADLRRLIKYCRIKYGSDHSDAELLRLFVEDYPELVAPTDSQDEEP